MFHAPLLAEVLSNEPLIGTLWLTYLTLGGLGYLVCRRYPWALVLMLPLSLAFTLPIILELYDPEVGPAIWSESWTYFVQANVAIAAAVAGPYLGAIRTESEWESQAG